ncbi:MAG: hypothetical protein M1144_03535 [Candidatus Thermoplasmatota archaeon]|nr:hypothetical protein [Candidatus Thermoplasmatota archaeon]
MIRDHARRLDLPPGPAVDDGEVPEAVAEHDPGDVVQVHLGEADVGPLLDDLAQFLVLEVGALEQLLGAHEPDELHPVGDHGHAGAPAPDQALDGLSDRGRFEKILDIEDHVVLDLLSHANCLPRTGHCATT